MCIECKVSHFMRLRGKEHILLGMSIKLRNDNKIKFDIIEQIQEVIEWLGEEIEKNVYTPANNKSSIFDNNTLQLSTEQYQIFHSVVAKLLCIHQRGRPNTETTVVFLCTRFSKSTLEDWKRLRCILSCLDEVINDKRIIGENSLQILHTLIDTAYSILYI